MTCATQSSQIASKQSCTKVTSVRTILMPKWHAPIANSYSRKKLLLRAIWPNAPSSNATLASLASPRAWSSCSKSRTKNKNRSCPSLRPNHPSITRSNLKKQMSNGLWPLQPASIKVSKSQLNLKILRVVDGLNQPSSQPLQVSQPLWVSRVWAKAPCSPKVLWAGKFRPICSRGMHS